MIDEMMRMILKARRIGYVALEEDMEYMGNSNYDTLIKLGLELLINGYDSDIIKQVFNNLIEYSNFEDVNAIDIRMILCFIMCLYNEENPYMAECLLYSNIGKVKYKGVESK